MTERGMVKAWEATNLVNGESYKLNDPRNSKDRIVID
jgi:hypothetical protein